MKFYRLVYFLLFIISTMTVPVANADEEGPALSFSQPDTYNAVAKSVDMLSIWAKGEYIEHKAIFLKHPKDGAIIQATLAIVKELKDLSKKAKAAGDKNKALAYLYSAEAAARYAAQMPHYLEERLEHKKPK